MRVAPVRNPALIVVDVQRDFMPGGALPVPKGDEVVAPLNVLISHFAERGFTLIYTRDWHPPDHVSFRQRGGPWPPHCVQGSEGAEFHPDLVIPQGAVVVSKATDRDKDAYSGFGGTDLEKVLRDKGVRRLFVGGVATEYCVKSTVLDALRLGFEVFVVEDAIRGIDPDGEEKAKIEMVKEGAVLIRLDEILLG